MPFSILYSFAFSLTFTPLKSLSSMYSQFTQGTVTMVDFEMWKDAVGSLDNWRMISYPGLTHLFMPGAKSEGPDAYSRGGKVQENVIQDIASFINEVR